MSNKECRIMKCCIATLYLPLFYKLGSITSKFMVSIFDIGYFNPLRGGFLSAPALRVEAQCSRAPSNPGTLGRQEAWKL